MSIVRAGWSALTRWSLPLCAILLGSGCSAKYAQLPPRVDLAPYGRIALVTFSAEDSYSELSALATQRFAEAVLAGQPGIELLELGVADSSLAALASNGDGTALAQALGRDRDVAAVFVGALKVSGVKPSGRLSAGGMNVRASVTAELSLRLLSTRSGGTVWRGNSAASGTLGRMAVSRGMPAVAVRDRDAAYGEIVSALVAGATRDLRPSWVKQ